MGAKIGLILVAALAFFSLTTLPVNANVVNVNISPLVLVAGGPITFYGEVSGSSQSSQIGVYVFVSLDCQSPNLFASTFTAANTTDTYSVTLAFPVDVEFSGWKLEQHYQQYQSGLPAGSYNVGVADMVAVSNGSGGICRNFTINPQPVPEFSMATLALLLTLVAALYFVRLKRTVPPNWQR